MKKVLLIAFVAACLCQGIVQAQTQIDSIQFIGATVDNLVFIVHSSADIEVFEYYVKYEEESDIIKVNIQYSSGWDEPECYCPIQTEIKIKKNVYLKAFVSIMIRYPIGGTEENPEYSDDYQLRGSKEIYLSNFNETIINITSINSSPVLSKIVIFPNPVQNIFHINLGENKTANLEIYDIQGSLLLHKNIIAEKEIDVSFLSSGLYFVIIDRKYISRIIKK